MTAGTYRFTVTYQPPARPAFTVLKGSAAINDQAVPDDGRNPRAIRALLMTGIRACIAQIKEAPNSNA